MLTPISLDFSLSSSPENLLPDNSGLAPLSIPEEFLTRHSPPQSSAPSPDAIRRFQTALADNSPSPASLLSLFSRPHSESLSSTPQPPSPSSFPVFPPSPDDRTVRLPAAPSAPAPALAPVPHLSTPPQPLSPLPGAPLSSSAVPPPSPSLASSPVFSASLPPSLRVSALTQEPVSPSSAPLPPPANHAAPSPAPSIPATPPAVVPPETFRLEESPSPRPLQPPSAQLSAFLGTAPRSVEPSLQPQRSQMNPIPASDATPSAIQQLLRLLPDTSGLAPLSLPPEILSRSQTPPTPDAIRRFQSAISDPVPPPDAPRQAPPSTQLPPSPLHALPAVSPEALPSLTSSPTSSFLPALPPPADLAKKADILARVLFSHLEPIPPETLEQRELRIPLAPSVLDASSVAVTAQEGVLFVQVVLSNPSVIPIASALLPRLTDNLKVLLPAFPHAQIVLSSPDITIPDVSRVAELPHSLGEPETKSASLQLTPPPASSLERIPAADLAQTATQLLEVLSARLETLPLASLEQRELRIPLESSVLDASTIVVTAKDAHLFATIVPSKPDIVPLASAILPRIVESMEKQFPAFQGTQVILAAPEVSNAPSQMANLPGNVGKTQPSAPLPPDADKLIPRLAEVITSRLEAIAPEALEHRELRIPLSSSISDASAIVVNAKEGVLFVQAVPSNPDAVPLVSALLPHLKQSLEGKLPTFRDMRVVSAVSEIPVPDASGMAAGPSEGGRVGELSGANPALPIPNVPGAARLPASSADLDKVTTQIVGILSSRLENISPETLVQRELRIPLDAAILDASSVVVTAKEGILSVTLVPSKPDIVPLVSALLPNLAEALEVQLPAFPHPQVALAFPNTPGLDAPRLAAGPSEGSRVGELSGANPASPIPNAPGAPRLPVSSADLDKVATQIVGILSSRLENISPETLVQRELRIPLDAAILDASSVVVTAKEGILSVTLVPSKPDIVPLVSALLPNLAEALEVQLPAFPHPQVALAFPNTPGLDAPRLAAGPSEGGRVGEFGDAISTMPISTAPSFSSLPPPADFAQQAAQVAEVLFSRLETLPPATLESREIRIPLAPALLDASTVVVTVKEDVLLVTLVPSTPEVVPVASALLPHIAELVEVRLPAFPRPQVVLATPETSRVAALPEDDTPRPATREIPPSEVLRPVSSPARPSPASDQDPAPLQALPYSAPAPLETTSAPSASRPVIPVQPVAPAPEFAPAPVAAEPPRQVDASPAQDPETPPAPLQAIPFVPPVPLDATSSTPTPPPAAASIPPASPAMPAAPSSFAGESLPNPAQSRTAPPAPAPQASAPLPNSLPPANDPTVQRSNDPTVQRSNDPTVQRSNDPTIQRSNDPTIKPPSPLQAAPVDVPAPAAAPVPLADPSAVASAASARTASIAETVDQIASAVASRILVTPSLRAGGDGQIRITLQPAVLDGSTVTLTARNGTLAVAVVPATAEAAALAAAALPQLAAAMEAHAPAFRRVQVSLASKKGNPDETV